MVRTRDVVLPGLLVLGLSLGAVGCGATTVTDANGNKTTVNGNKVTVTDKSGNTVASGGEGLPSGFPKAEVPLISGTIAFGETSAGKGWSVQIKSSKSPADAVKEAEAELRAKGFTEKSSTTVGGISALQMSSAKYNVVVTGSAAPVAGAKSVVSYTVLPGSQ